MFTSLFMFLSLLFASSVSKGGEIVETVICAKATKSAYWSQGDECYGVPDDQILDPTSEDFFEKFEDMRDGNKNVVLGLLSSRSFPTIILKFQLAYFNTLNIRFVSTNYRYASYVPIVDFVYSSIDDITKSNISIGRMTANFINTDNDAKEISLNLGHLSFNHTSSEINFYKNNVADPKFTIHAKTLDAPIENLTNITDIDVSGELLSLYTQKKDKFNLTISKDTKINNIALKLASDTTLAFDGGKSANLDLNIETGASVPSFSFVNISTLGIQGSWTSTSLSTIANCSNIIVNGDSFPFSIEGSAALTVGKSLTIQGPVFMNQYSKSTPTLIIDTIKKDSEINLKFNEVQAVIKVNDADIKASIDYLHYVVYSGTDFPISFGINDFKCSLVTIKKVDFDVKMPVFKSVTYYADIKKQLSDSELEKRGFYSGMKFAVFPKNVSFPLALTTAIDKNSPSIKSDIPGFNTASNTLKVHNEEEADSTIMKFNMTSPFDVLVKVQYLSSGGWNPPKCPNGVICLKDSNISRLNDLKSFLPQGMKNIQFEFTAKGVTINLSSLDPSISDYNITFKGSNSYIYKIEYGSTLNMIRSLYLAGVKIADGLNLTMNMVNLDRSKFENTAIIKYGQNTNISGDTYSLSSIVLNEKSDTLPHLYLSLGYNYQIKFRQSNMSISQLMSSYSFDISYNKWPKAIEIVFTYSKMFIESEITENVTIPGTTMKLTRDMVLEYRGKWANITFSSDMIIDHSDYDLTVIYTLPKQGRGVKYMGNGKRTFDVEYKDETKYCVYLTSQDLCTYTAGIATKYDDFVTMLTDPTFTKVYLTISLADLTDPITIPFSFLDSKKITFKGLAQNAQQTVSISIKNDEPMLDKQFSSVEFSNVVLDTHVTGSDVANLTFGKLILTNSIVKDSSKLNITVDDMTCDTSNLNQFMNITITDNLVLSGSYESEKAVKVNFVNDDNANDLTASVGSCKIYVDESCVQINKYSFLITRSFNFDALIKIDGKSDVDVSMDPKANVSEIPLITLLPTTRYSNITFSGQYPNFGNEDVFMIENATYTNVYVKSFIPLIVRTPVNITLFAADKDVGISGPIIISGTGSTEVRTLFDAAEDIQADRIKFTVSKGFIVDSGNRPQVSVRSPKLDIVAKNVDKSPTFDKSFFIQFIMLMRPEGISTISFTEAFGENVTLYNGASIDPEIFGLINENDFPFLKKEHLVYRAKKVDIDKITRLQISYETFYNENNISHGFNAKANAMAIKIVDTDDGYANVVAYAAKMPSEIPYQIDYLQKETFQKVVGNLVIYESTASLLDDLKSYIPPVLSCLIFNVTTNMLKQHPFKVNQILEEDNGVKNISIIGKGNPTTVIDLPRSGNHNIFFKNVNIDMVIFDGNSTFDEPQPIVANLLSIVDCNIFELDDFYIEEKNVKSLILDVDSLTTTLNNKVFKLPYNKPLTVESANIITFTKTGWDFKELRIKPTTKLSSNDCKDVTFKSDRDVEFNLEDGLTSVHGIKMISQPREGKDSLTYTFSAGWNKVTDASGLSIDVNGFNLNIKAASYPLPNIFKNEENVTYQFIEDDSGKFDEIIYPSGTVIDKSFSFDLTNLDNQYQHIKASKITFDKTVDFEFVDDVGTFYVDDLEILNKSDVTFGKVEVKNSLTLNGDMYVRGKISFSPAAKVVLNWERSDVPDLILLDDQMTLPQEIKLKFHGSDLDYAYYNELFYNTEMSVIYGNFNCRELLKRTFLESESPLFSQGSNFLSLKCRPKGSMNYIVLKGTELIPIPTPTPYPDDQGGGSGGDYQDNSLKAGPIIGIVIACVVVVGVIIGVVVNRATRSKYEHLLSSQPLEMRDQDESKYSTQNTEVL